MPSIYTTPELQRKYLLAERIEEDVKSLYYEHGEAKLTETDAEELYNKLAVAEKRLGAIKANLLNHYKF